MPEIINSEFITDRLDKKQTETKKLKITSKINLNKVVIIIQEVLIYFLKFSINEQITQSM